MLSKVIERVKYLNRQEKLKEESEKLSKEFYENSGLKEINNMTFKDTTVDININI